MSTSFADAIADVYAQLAATPANPTSTPVGALADVVSLVYDHEPGPSMAQKPVSLTVCPGGTSPTDWIVTVRIYVSNDLPAREQQMKLVAAMEAVDGVLTEGPSQWTFQYAEQLNTFLAVCPLQVGREDMMG